MPEIILTVGNQRHRGWTQVRIIRSLDYAAHAFELSLTQRWNDYQQRPVRAGQACTIKLDNELLITGRIDAIDIQHDAKSHTIKTHGRSRIADLIDCSTTGKEFKNQSLLQIATSLCALFEIPVRAEVAVPTPFNSLRLAPGQPIFEFLEYAARIRAVRLISNVKGELVITRTGSALADTALVLGKNIAATRSSVDLSNTYRTYTVIAQQGENPLLTAETQTYPTGSAMDLRATNLKRTTVIELDNPADDAACKIRAEWERNTHFGRSRSAVMTVSGWQQTQNGRTWQPNEIVAVDNSAIGIKGQRLISSTELILDHQGSRTEITLQPKEAFDLVELPEPESTEVWG